MITSKSLSKSLLPSTSTSRVAFLAGILLVLSCGSGCGYYSTSAIGGSSFKSIAVPLFKNETLEHGLEEDVTRAVVDAFVADNHMDVVAETEAESILWGTIATYHRSPFSFDAQGSVVEYKLEIVAKVEYEDRKRSKTMWREEDLRAWATYVLEGAEASSEDTDKIATGEEAGQAAVIEKLARELVAKTIGGW